MTARNALIDSHCHLDFPEFNHDRQQVIAAACERGVEAICIPGTESKRWQSLLQMTTDNNSQARLFPALGIHPWFIEQHNQKDLQILQQHLQSRDQIIAVGEIGLDYALKGADQEKQILWLTAQLELARQFQLPVILHARKAHDQILKQLRSRPVTRGGIVHAFSGSEQQAYQYIEQGVLIGLGGSITYPRASKTRTLAASLPLSAIVLETDAPDMPLHGYQGQRNEPARLVQVLATLAELRSESAAEIAETTRNNTLDLFAIHNKG